MVVRSPGSRPSQIAWIVRRSIFPDRVFGNCRNKPDVRRATEVANLAVHQRHNRLLLRMRHITIFQTIALFRNDKRHRHLPFQRIFHPNHRHFGNARMAGDTLFNLARAQTMPGNVNYIVSAPEELNAITVSVTDAQSKVAYTGGKTATSKSSQSGRRRPRWSEYSPAAAALPPPASLSR